MNRIYKLVIEQIKNTSEEAMPKEDIEKWIEQQRSAQRAWIKFRDEDSKVTEYSYYHGSMWPAEEYHWKKRLTEQRINDLKTRYKKILNHALHLDGNSAALFSRR